MRPKSIATVVVRFSGLPPSPSTPADALVTNASVRRGMISDTAPTNVVLPAPKPPEMTIFVEAARRLSARTVGASRPSECPEATQGPSYQFASFVVRRRITEGGVHPQITLHHQVTDQHSRHAERHREMSGDLGDRWAVDTHCQDLAAHIVSRPFRRRPGGQRFDGRLERKMDAGIGTARGQRIRPDQIRLDVGIGLPPRSAS